MDRKRLDSSTRTFIELDDRTESQDGVERGMAESGSIASQSSETPIHKKLVPYNGEMEYECSAKVDAGDIQGPTIKAERREGTMMTKTVDQSSQNMV